MSYYRSINMKTRLTVFWFCLTRLTLTSTLPVYQPASSTGTEQVKQSLPRVFDPQAPGGGGGTSQGGGAKSAGLSKLRETRSIFEQRALQVRAGPPGKGEEGGVSQGSEREEHPASQRTRMKTNRSPPASWEAKPRPGSDGKGAKSAASRLVQADVDAALENGERETPPIAAQEAEPERKGEEEEPSLCAIETYPEEGVKYIKFNEVLELHPEATSVTEPISSILWRHGGNKLAEFLKDFEGLELEYYGPSKKRTELNTLTGKLVVNNMNISDGGNYSVEVNGRQQRNILVNLMRHRSIPLGGSVEFTPDRQKPNFVTLCKYKSSKGHEVAKWDFSDPSLTQEDVNGAFLDKGTGKIFLKILTMQDGGQYFLMFDHKKSELYNVEVFLCVPTNVLVAPDCISNTAVVSWSASKGALRYSVSAWGSQVNATCWSSDLNCTLNITCGSNYTVDVKAINGNCSSDPSQTLTFSSAPCAPVNVSASLGCPNSADVTWQRSPSATAYNVTAVGQDGHIHYCSTNSTGCQIPNMHCGQNYTITVTPYADSCAGIPSIPYHFIAGPCRPSNVSVSAVCGDSTVSWSNVSGADMYIATATAHDGHNHTCNSSSANSCSFTDLHCGENYSVSVVAVDRGCHTEPSSAVELKTGNTSTTTIVICVVVGIPLVLLAISAILKAISVKKKRRESHRMVDTEATDKEKIELHNLTRSNPDMNRESGYIPSGRNSTISEFQSKNNTPVRDSTLSLFDSGNNTPLRKCTPSLNHYEDNMDGDGLQMQGPLNATTEDISVSETIHLMRTANQRSQSTVVDANSSQHQSTG